MNFDCVSSLNLDSQTSKQKLKCHAKMFFTFVLYVDFSIVCFLLKNLIK